MRNPNRSVLVVAAGALLALGAARASEDVPAIPAARFIAAIQTAVAAHPGDVADAEVERDRGRTIVEVELVLTDGGRAEVKVDVEKNEVVGWQKKR